METGEDGRGRREGGSTRYSREIMKFMSALLVSLLLLAEVSLAADFKYIRRGNRQDVQTRAEAGIAMMGGGSDLDEAFRWLCAKGTAATF